MNKKAYLVAVRATMSTIMRSINKYCISESMELLQYISNTEINWINEYVAMYLNIPYEVTSAQRPSLITVDTQLIDASLDVNGLATLASRSDNEIPTEARFNAPQSLAPSPQ